MFGRVIHMPSARVNLLVALVLLPVAGSFFMRAQPVSAGPPPTWTFQSGSETRIVDRAEATGQAGSMLTTQSESTTDVSGLTGVSSRAILYQRESPNPYQP